MTAQLAFQKPTSLRFGRYLELVPPVLSASLTGAWRFNKASGETDAQAAERCSWNMAPGASNAPSGRRWPGGVPTFSTGSARFLNGGPLVTAVPDFGTGGGCALFVARTQDTGIVNANTRGFLGGSYGGNTNKGWGFEFTVYATAQARAIDYNAAGTVQTNTIDMGAAATDLEKWRIYYVETGRVSGSDALLAAVNLTADGTTPDPTDTTLTAGRSAGTQTVTIGGRISDTTTNYTATIHKDIALVLVFDALPTAGQRTTLAEWVASLAADAGLTIGAI